MSDLGDMNFEKFKQEVCVRCDSVYELKRRENILNKVFESFSEEASLSFDDELKYDLGAEGAKTVFKKRCVYVDKCDEIGDLMESVSALEERLSKLMYYLMQHDRKQDVLYISADVDSLYPMLLNRIIRSDAAKKTVLQDKYDTKELMEKFQSNNGENK